jgi:hypothetical protein
MDGIYKYGRVWKIPQSPLAEIRIEMEAFRLGLTKQEGGLGKARHYRNLVSAIWPDYDWHPWAQLQALALCQNQVVGFAGCTDSGKSESLAVWILVNWFVAPLDTLCIVTSTTAMDAKQRIWGAITRRYREAKKKGIAPGKIVESLNIIKLTEDDGEGIDKGISENSSIVLVAAGNDAKDDAQKRLQGRKNKRIFLVCDESQDCSPTILNEAIYSLKDPHVSLAGNPASIFDPHGKACTPINGWLSVDPDTPHWKIKVAGIEGICLRFDGEKSPNNEEWNAKEKIKYQYLPHPKTVALAQKELGELNPQYWRKFRGMWPPADVDDTHVFTEILIKKHSGLEKAFWEGDPHNIAGVDPSYTEGGDRFVFTHLKYGLINTGQWVIGVENQYTLNRRKESEEDYQYEMIEQIVALKNKLGITNENIGVDASAGGIFWSIGEKGPLTNWLAVPFHGAATDRAISAQHELRNEDGTLKTGKEVFANRSSELCFVGRYFLDAGQVRGITPDLASEMCQRKFERKNRKIIVESKREMKKRIGKSPDLWDSFSIGVDVIRERFGAIAGGEAIAIKQQNERNAWAFLKQKLTLTSNW